MTCKCNHEEYLHINDGPCTGIKVSGTITNPCKCKKFVEKVIDINHTKTLEQERAKRSADVEVVFTTGNCFNVLASKDELDRTGKILIHAKGSVKYNGEISIFPSLTDWCSCPSFENGVPLDETHAFQCKHIIAARNKKYIFIDDLADLPPDEAKLLLDTMSSNIKHVMERITEEDKFTKKDNFEQKLVDKDLLL